VTFLALAHRGSESRNMELRYWLVHGNVKNAFVDTVGMKSVDLKNTFLF